MSVNYAALAASDGNGEAVRATVQTVRNIGSTSIIVDHTTHWPTGTFIATTGTLLASGKLDPTTVQVFYGTASGTTITISSYAAGYSDLGSKQGDVVVLKPSTEWANNLFSGLGVSFNSNGTLKNSAITYNPNIFDYVAPNSDGSVGCVLTGTGYGTTLAWSLTAGIVYIGGNRYTVAAATGSVIASKDTYFDLLAPVSGTVATLVNTSGNIVANNAASPALAANSIRIGIIQSGVTITAVGAINQGQETMLLPIISSVPLAVTDYLGNLICPRDPQRKLLGLKQTTTSVSGISAETAIAPLSCPFIVPTGRKVKISAYTAAGSGSVTGDTLQLNIKTGSTIVQSGTAGVHPTTGAIAAIHAVYETTPASASNTYFVTYQRGAGTGTVAPTIGSTQIAYIIVELV